MTERPNAIFALLVGGVAVAAVLLAAALASLGSIGALAAVVVGALTACIFLLDDLQRLPLPALVLTLLGTVSALAVVRTLAAHLREQRLLSALPLQVLDDHATRAVAAAAGIDAFYVTPARRPVAFCFGVLHPRVVVSAGLLAELDGDERAAVLWHEAHHARDRVPLKCLLARIAVAGFFWLPALRDVRDRYLLVVELAADRVAASRTSPAALAGALVAVSVPPPGAVGLGDAADARVDRLADPCSPLPRLFGRWALVASAVSVMALALLLWVQGSVEMGESEELGAMLSALSLHGLPGMAGGLVLNLGALALARPLGHAVRLGGQRARRPSPRGRGLDC